MANNVAGELRITLALDKSGASNFVNDTEKIVANGGAKISGTWATKIGVISSITSKVFDKVASTISGSMSTAIKRVDTLNNANTVFQALGYNADSVSDSMASLGSYLDGLPTSMTDAISGVQSLSASFGGIEKGTEYYMALNNAGLAFGATSDMIANAITQLGQLSLDGPLDAATWNSLQNSGFQPVFAAMAKEAGMTVGELKADFGGRGTKTVQDFLDELLKLDKEGSGAMESLRSIARKNTNGIGTALENVQNRVGKAIAKVIDAIGAENIANTINNISSSFSSMADIVVGAIQWIGENANWLIPLVGGVVAAFAAYEAIATAVSIAQGIMNAVMLANPIGLIIAGVVGLVTILVLLWNNCEDFRNFVMGVINAIGSAIGAVGGFIGKVFDKIGSIANAVFNSVGKTVKNVTDTISKIFQKVGATIGSVIGNISVFFTSLFDTVSGVFSAIGDFVGGIINNIVGYFEWWWNTMTSIFSAIGQFFTNAFAVPIAIVQKLIEVIGKIGEIIGAVVYGTVATAVNFFGSIFSKLWQGIQEGLTNLKNFFSSIFSAIGGFVSNIVNTIKNTFTTAFTSIGNFVGNIANTIKNVFQTAWNAIMSGLTTVGNFFKNIFNAVWSVVSGVVNNIRNAFQGAWNFMTGIFNGVGNFFRNVFTAALNNIKNVFGAVGSFFQGVWNNIVRIFTSVGSAVGNAVSGAFKSVVNGVLGFVENFVNTPIKLLNGFIDVINNAFGWVGVNVGRIGLISLPRMEHGGIVPGNDYSGDHNLIRANSGEMVITRSQQAALWDMIERANYGDYGESEAGSIDNSSIDITNNYQINSALDAEEMGDIIVESIRKAVI